MTIKSDVRKPGVAFWASVALAIPVLYVLSFGPACWLVDRGNARIEVVARVYRPFVRAAAAENGIGRFLKWYGGLDRPRNTPATTIPMTGWMNFYLNLFDAGEV